MNIECINGIAVVRDAGMVLTDVQSALDLIADVGYRADSNTIVLFKENIAADFFKLSTGLLGEVLQKFVTYGVYLAIVGDFSTYSSRPLRDFIYESNKGGHIYFAPDEQAAITHIQSLYG